MLGNLLRK
ncbi:31750eae-b5b7-49ba-922e-d3bc7e0e14d8 [Thermothielavioides terrestris]|uniref:31750eae-b5b7-49ba-922e-d3bc7e0e14d8 n=1 Tax=Thermothielavioides terrestris TaxID=2587410 RepID=A0A3S5CVR9_9PEZI|nr:31750eae-b5b7-49ba-922e-d3bc7e0e14d8 [Thermothielavioides terrestris]